MNKLTYFLIGVIFVLISCQKDNIDDNIVTNNTQKPTEIEYSLINGRLAFADAESFERHLDWIYTNQKEPEIINQFNAKTGFQSMMDIYTKGISIENEEDFINYLNSNSNSFYPVNVDESIFYEMPAPAALAYISNKDGLYQVGKSICRITYDYFLEITDGDESKIPLLFLPIEEIAESSIKITETHDLNERGQFSYRTVYFNSKNRVVARLYKNSAGGAWFYEARTTSQKKRFGIWIQRDISEVGVSWPQGYAEYYAWGYPLTISASTNTDYSSSNIMMTVFIAHYTVDNSNSSCIIKHWGKDGSNYQEITNNQMFP